MDERKDKPEYLCVFDIKPCPVRMQYKLQPENLLGYCIICHINPTNKQEPTRSMEMEEKILEVKLTYDVMFKILDMYLELEKDEREPFLEVAVKLIRWPLERQTQ